MIEDETEEAPALVSVKPVPSEETVVHWMGESTCVHLPFGTVLVRSDGTIEFIERDRAAKGKVLHGRMYKLTEEHAKAVEKAFTRAWLGAQAWKRHLAGHNTCLIYHEAGGRLIVRTHGHTFPIRISTLRRARACGFCIRELRRSEDGCYGSAPTHLKMYVAAEIPSSRDSRDWERRSFLRHFRICTSCVDRLKSKPVGLRAVKGG